MGRLRVKLPRGRLARSRAGTAAGAGLAVAGVWLWFGVAVALVVAGVLLMAYCLLIADIAEPAPDDGRDREW